MITCCKTPAKSFVLAAIALVLAGAMGPAEAQRRGGGGAHARGGGGAHAAHAGSARAAQGARHAPAAARPQVNNSHADARSRNVRSNSVNQVSNRNINANRNVNVNSNRNVNVNVDRGGCCGWDNDFHPVATAAAVTATMAVTSAVVGSIVNTVPAGCVPVNYGGMVYQQCGASWYMPQAGQYIVVNPPY